MILDQSFQFLSSTIWKNALQNYRKRKKKLLLKGNADNFEAKQNKQINKQTTTRVMEKLNWWLEIIPGFLSSINKPEVNFVVNTDATKSG